MGRLKRIRKKGKKLTSLQEARNVDRLLRSDAGSRLGEDAGSWLGEDAGGDPAHIREEDQIEELGLLPSPDESLRIVTFTEFSAVGLLRWIVEQTYVRWMGIVTFRVGPRCISYLKHAGDAGLIGGASFILGWLSQSHHGPARELAEQLETVCSRFGWDVRYARNHVKVMLFDTDAGKLVVETSSNLNDLPNWEQFCVENDAELYDFYHGIFYGPDGPAAGHTRPGSIAGAPPADPEPGKDESPCRGRKSPSPSLRPRVKNTSPNLKSRSVKPRK